MRYGRRGAGILLVAKSTGRVLLLLRGQECNEPGTWGLPGGKIEPGEEARTASIRELEEEAGWDGEVTVLRDPIFVFEEPDFEFFNYFGFVEDEFEPQLNWESDEAGWFTLDRLPRPLHFGVERLFRERRRDIVREIDQIPR
jgi:8-oxo-dGTP pyrophosphatase MutT (NUDIX family)